MPRVIRANEAAWAAAANNADLQTQFEQCFVEAQETLPYAGRTLSERLKTAKSYIHYIAINYPALVGAEWSRDGLLGILTCIMFHRSHAHLMYNIERVYKFLITRVHCSQGRRQGERMCYKSLVTLRWNILALVSCFAS